MKTASEILASHHIEVRSLRFGVNMLTRCPKCSDLRKKRRDPCLSVKILDDGVVWNCHHCGDKDGEYFEQRSDKPTWTPPAQRGPQKPKGGGYARLQHQAASAWR